MPTIYDLKPRFQNMLRPIARSFARLGVTPNQLTLAGLIVSSLAGLAVWVAPTARLPLLAYPVALVARMALNALDGMVARLERRESRAGAVLNDVADILSDVVLTVPLAFVPGLRPSLVAVVAVLALAVEAAGVARGLGPLRVHDGPMGKSDRAVALGVIVLAIATRVATPFALDAVLGIVAILEVVTVGNRLRRVMPFEEVRRVLHSRARQ